MIINAITYYRGEKCPDPSYKNIYYFPDYPGVVDNLRPLYFFNSFLAADKYTFTPTDPIYCVGENERGFTLDVTDIPDFPDPVYMAISTPVGYRYAFIIGRSRLSQHKNRFSCLFDQWAEHFREIVGERFTFSRRHRDRFYIDASDVWRNIPNGLSDPVAEGMLFSHTVKRPLLCYGAFYDSIGDDTYIPLWRYFRLKTTELYKWDSNEHKYVTYPDDIFTGTDFYKSSAPIVCGFIGLAKIHESAPRSCTILFCDSQGVGTPNDYEGIMKAESPYIAESWVSTIPPAAFSVTLSGTPKKPILSFDSPLDLFISRYVVEGGDLISGSRIGTNTASGWDPPAGLVLVNTKWKTQAATYLHYPVTDNEAPATIAGREFYEPKINESPYSRTVLSLYGVDADVSFSIGRRESAVDLPIGGHAPARVMVDGREALQIDGIVAPYSVDIVNDSLSQWLVANRNTYQNALLWKGINAGAGIVTSIASGNPGAMVAAGLGAVKTFTEERARLADLKDSPNAVNLASQNAFDNLPFVDLPTVSQTEPEDEARDRICAFWHLYGYPDNSIETIADTINRVDFNYYQGAPVAPLRGLVPSQYNDILGAIAGGVWIWRIFGGGISWASNITEDPLTLENGEKVTTDLSIL